MNDLNHYQRELMEYGFTILPPEFASPDRLDERLLEEVLAAAGEEQDDIDVRHAREYVNPTNPMGQQLFYLLARAGPFLDIVAHPQLVALSRYLIEGAIISSVTASLKGPGEVDLPLHADQPIHPTPRSLVCTAAVLLTDMSPEEGGLCFVPGSHNALRQPKELERNFSMHPNLFSVRAPAGSVVLWHANTWHGAHARAVPGLRVSLLIHWCSPMLRPQEPYRELLPDEILVRGGDTLIDLIGGGVHYGWTASGPDRRPLAAFSTARSRANANSRAGEASHDPSSGGSTTNLPE